MSAAFYCVADSRYFLGAAGTINSLRLLGHAEPIHVLDCGLDPGQRRLLAAEATIVEAPIDTAPTMLKTIAPLAHPAEVVVLLDSDLIVTRRLDALIDDAAHGRVVGFRNDMDRFDARWGEMLALGPIERRPYLSFALACFGGGARAAVLEPLAELQSEVDIERTMWGADDPSYALRYADQDVLNAVVAARVPADRVTAHSDHLLPIPPFHNLRVVDAGALRCAYPDGAEPYGVHHFLVKPWLERTHHGVYSQLLHRLLTGPDVAIRVPDELVPLRLRTGAFAYLERKRVNAGQRLRFHLREPVASRLRRSREGAGG